MANKSFLVVAIIAISSSIHAKAASPWPDKLSEGQIVFEQRFNWHDDLGSGTYIWGHDQYLTIDGSFGRIQCSRLLKEKLTGDTGRVEMDIVFVEGRKYRIALYDSSGKMVVDCSIDRDGWVSFHNGTSYVKTKANIGRNTKYGVEYSLMNSFGFGKFDFKAGQFQFAFNGKTDFPPMPLCSKARDISKLEVQTCVVEPGTIIGLHLVEHGERG